MPREKDQFTTVRHVAQTLGVSRNHIYDLIQRGDLTAYRFGSARAIRVPRSEIDRLLRISRVDHM